MMSAGHNDVVLIREHHREITVTVISETEINQNTGGDFATYVVTSYTVTSCNHVECLSEINKLKTKIYSEQVFVVVFLD